MRRDVTELKKCMSDIMSERAGGKPVAAPQEPVRYIPDTPVLVQQSQPVVMASVQPVSHITPAKPKVGEASEVQDTEEYVEENLSLDEVEKEMIRKALERHHGKRKSAANDLKISERTLYRKIKEYGLD